MAKSKKPDKDQFASDWMTQIKAGVEYRKKYSTRDNWEKYRRYYRGQWADQIVPINKIFSYGRMLIPKVYFRAPRVSVTASHPELFWHAKVVEALDNLCIQQMMLKYTLKSASLDTFLCGIGPIKLGYDSEFGYLPEQSFDESGETASQVSSTEHGERIEYHQNVKPGYPWALRTRPEDVIVPWGSESQFNLPWVAHYILRPLDDVKQDPKYQNTAHLQGTRTSTMIEEMRSQSSFRPRYSKDKGTLLCELWEIRDAKTKQVIVIAEEQLLMSAIDELQTGEGLPWEFVNFNPDPEYFWAIPDAHIISPQQEELNEVVTQTSRHRAIALLKFLYKRGALKQEELDKFLSGEVGPGVAVDDDSIASAIQTLQPHIPPELYRDAQAQIQAMREELGFSQNQEGSFSPYHGKTASESMIVAEASESRVDERKDIIADVLVRIIRKWNQFLFKFWNEKKVIQIISPQPGPVWVEFTGDEVKGDYMLNIDADSGMPISRAMKMQMGTEMFKAFNGDPLTDQVLLRQIALENYSIIDPRIPQLIQPQQGAPGQEEGTERQPDPAYDKGSGGGRGRKGSSPEQPEEFESFKNRMGQQ